jgi:subfamily B ATP-binding cassette protein MsbA
MTAEVVIKAEKLSFVYPDGREVLKDISLTIKRGEIVALIGPNGAGKSTLMNLLLRFYDVTEGEILIDGVRLDNANLQSLRNQIGIVTQQVILFNDTVKNNIAYGDIQKKEEEIVNAAKAANAHNFISALPNGYDTMIGEERMNTGCLAVLIAICLIFVPFGPQSAEGQAAQSSTNAASVL